MARRRTRFQKIRVKFTKTSRGFIRHITHRKHRRNTAIIAISLTVVLSILGYAYGSSLSPAPPKRLVTFHDRGHNRVILTNAKTVDKALLDADIRINTGDVVEPAIGTALTSTDSAVIVYRARPVLIVDGALRQKIVTAAASPNEILITAALRPLNTDDKATIEEGNIISDGASAIVRVTRATPGPLPAKIAFAPGPNALTRSKGAQLYTDGNGVVHRETYYDLPMNIVIGHCGLGDYSIRYDGAKVDKDGYVLVAASYRNYPLCSVVETSMGPGKVYDTGGFALRYPHGFDLATDWTNTNGR